MAELPLGAGDLAEIDAFCDALWLEDGLAKTSLASYRSDLAHLARWLRTQTPVHSLLTADEVAREMVLFLENTDSQGSIFRSNHASNYVPLGGTLNQDTPKLLAQLHQVMEQRAYKPEGFRGL